MAENNHFVALSECHFMNPQAMEEMEYYPGFEAWWKSIDGVMRSWGGGRDLAGGDAMPEPRAHALIEWMDKANVDVCFALRESMMDVSGYSTCMSTNAFMLKEIEPYPERMYLECNCGPMLRRGVDKAIWELEYLFNERVLLGVFNTIQLTVYSMVIGIVLGVVLTIMRLSGNPVMSAVAWVFLWVFRGTPVYVQLAFWGLLPVIYQNIQLGVPFGPTLVQFDLQSFSFPFLLAVLGLALNEAAYMAEIVRAGITSVPEGQLEASTALGMSWSLAMRRTVLPQAMRVIIPPTGNEVISLLKTTSLVTAVPYAFDLYSIATREIAARIFQPVPLLMVAAVWYLAITSVLMVGQFYLERYFSRGASRKLTDKQLEALAEAQGGDGA